MLIYIYIVDVEMLDAPAPGPMPAAIGSLTAAFKRLNLDADINILTDLFAAMSLADCPEIEMLDADELMDLE
jgi:hypothetical protein